MNKEHGVNNDQFNINIIGWLRQPQLPGNSDMSWSNKRKSLEKQGFAKFTNNILLSFNQ